VNEAFNTGWTATLSSGEPLEILRANAWAQAIHVPAASQAGDSIALQLNYRERSFFPGCLLFILGIAVALLL
jgi:hypothetical protein